MMPLSQVNDAATNGLDASIESLYRHRFPRDMLNRRAAVDSRSLEWRAILLGACTKKVVDTPKLNPWIKLLECSRQNAARKTINPSDEYFHSAKTAKSSHHRRISAPTTDCLIS